MAIEMDVSYANWEPPIPLRHDNRQALPVNSPFKQMLPEQIIVPQEDPVSMVDKSLAADSAFVQMHDALKASSGYPTVSGVQENDYPCIAASGASFQLHKLNTVPFPAKVLEQFNHVEQNSEIGLFNEIQRAWLTVDSSLYLWSYDGEGVTYYDSLTEVIIGVALVKPKAGVFRPEIKHILCLTTLVEIVLLGVQQRDASTVEILPEPLFRIATDNVPMNIISGTDEGRIFLGGKDGCLYEAMYHGPGTWLGKRCWKVNHSASLISYLIPAVLDFSEKIPIIQIEVDNSRHILFARFRNGTIEIYDLGNDGKAMSKVTSRTWSSISAQASSLARNIEAENFRTLSKICVVEQTESSFINLIGFTDTGIRIFFSTSRDSQPNRRPETLDIVHIRLPPGYSPSSPPQRPSSVHLASYRRGTTIMVSSMNDGRTLLWALSSDAFSFHDQFMELFSVHPISSRTWDMQEEIKPQPIKQNVQIQLGPSRSYSLEPPLLVTQDMENQRKYLFLSSQGVHIAFKPRPVDHLKQLLIDNQGFENESVRSFFRLYGEIHSCGMILALASQTVSHLEKQIAEWATLAYFRYGGDPLITTTSQPVGLHHQIFPTSPTSSLQHHHHILQSAPGSPAGHISTPISSTPRVSPNMDILQSSPITSPLSPQNKVPYSPLASMIRFSPQDEGQPYRDYLMGTPQGTAATTHVHYEMSNKLKGLYLYLSRIVRQIWNHNAVHIETVSQPIPNGPKEIYHSSISTEEINIYIEKLNNLRNFLNKNIQFSSDLRLDLIHPRMNGGGSINFTNPNQVNPIIERTSFYKALQLIERIREVLGLWRIISEHNFHSVVEHMPNDAPSVLRTVSFRDLTTTGSELCAHLASALVQKYIEDHTATDCISQRLKDACPSIFRSENVLQAKAHEILIKARGTPDPAQRSKMIEQGLQTFKRIGARINIRQACELLKSVHAYVDIANICLSAASQRDPENKCKVYTQDAFNLLEHIQHSPKSPESHSLYDPVKIEDSRLECYRIILETYEYLLCRVENPANTLIQPSYSKKDQTDAIPPITKEDALNFSKSILKTVISSDDQIAHYAFYEWFYEHQKLDKLLEIRSPHVEFYLKNKASAFGDSHQMMDLLWMYYERNGNYRAAALILDKLARKHSSEIDLLKRIEYLSRAIICMKSCQSHSALMSMEDKDLKTSGELLHDLEERMEVARLQFKTLETLSQRPDSSSQPVRDAIKELNEDLLDITALYENFADRFDLPEAQLAIVYTASHNDPELVKTLWKKIMDRELASSVIKPITMRKTLLVNKITNLAKQYMPSERYLPIEFIVQYLENVTHNLDFEREWLASALLSCGLSIHQLVEIYHKLFRSRESNASWMRKSIQILQVSYWLFKKFCDNPSCIVHTERRHFTATCLDLMAEYLLELQSNNNNDPQVSELISRFRELQSKLERMSFN